MARRSFGITSKVRNWFYDPDYLTEMVNEVASAPFWLEENGIVVPFPSDNSGKLPQHISIYFQHALPTFGFYNLILGDDNEFVPVHMRGNIAVEVNDTYIKNFIKYALTFLPNGSEIVDQMTQKTGRFFGKSILNSLRPRLDLAPLKDSRGIAYRFYRSGVVRIKNDQTELISYDELPEGKFVWGNQILDRDFDASLVDKFDKEDFLSDKTETTGNHFHKWCQNLCKQQEGTEWVYKQNKFKTLASGFGYLLHRYWSEYKCVILVDEDLEVGKANGRTGKSVILMDALSNALDTAVVDAGLIKKGADNKFLFNFVSPTTQYIALDDSREDFDFNTLFSKITGPLVAERKYGGMYQFSKQDKPKMSLSSNHPIIGDGASYIDRQHLCEVGGFYRFHKMELNKSPDKFHGGMLFDDEWSELNWKEFDAFCVNALRYYLQVGLVGGEASSQYQYKKLVSSVGSSDMVNTLHRFLETNAGELTYQKKMAGMSNDEEKRCLLEYVKDSHPEDNITLKQLSTSFHSVASHFGFPINRGTKDRPQKRFNGKGVNSYQINHPNDPFGKKNKKSEVINVSLDNDPVDRLEKSLSNTELLERPTLPDTVPTK